jgi:hypothetical protein
VSRGPPNLGPWSAMMGFFKVLALSLVIILVCEMVSTEVPLMHPLLGFLPLFKSE